MAGDRDILPTSVRPTHYDLQLHNLELGGTWSYDGTVTIALQVKEATKQIVLNSYQLRIREAEIQSSGIKANNISYNDSQRQATLEFSELINTSSHATLVIKFSGTMNDVMAGFSRSKYKATVPPISSVPKDDEFHYMFSTQFESCDARRAFPCFDEPNLKASFDFAIEIPEDQTALSNMPEKSSVQAPRKGFKMVSFERTPIMSTYLLAWAFGDFEYVEDFTKRQYNGKNIPVRVYATRGLQEQGRFALENAHQVIDYFSEVFRIDYPLPKADLLAVHEFANGAMENWGLVTYRTTAVLFDEAQSDQKYKNRIAYVVAHELAHQWFGNLVTMDWWSELWLNEGFATWVGWFAVDHLYPEWNVWGQFVTESVQTAFALDSLRNSHPIEVAVRDALEVDQVFDSISYLKGSSVIRMLSAHMGQEKFLLGVSNYLKAHAYGNATTNDLWSSLSEAAGQDVNTFMDSWVRQIGFPVLTVAEEPGQLSVRQSRFLTTGDVKPEEDHTTWWLPLGLRTDMKSKKVTSTALTTKEDTLRSIDETFYKLNTDQTGFYRTSYPPARLLKLGEMRNHLSVEDRIGLIGDAAALATSGDGTTGALLMLLEQFQAEEDYLVWSQIVASLKHLQLVFSSNEKLASGLERFTLKLVTPATERVGWNFPANESFLTGQLRSLLIATAGLAGHEGIISEARKQFQRYHSEQDKKAIHPSLRSAVFRIVVTEGTKADYEAVKQDFLTTSSPDGKELALAAMARVQSAELAEEFFAFLFSGTVAVQDIRNGTAPMSANTKIRLTLWHCMKNNWSMVVEKLGGNMVNLERLMKMSLNKFADRAVEKDIADFFRDKDNRGYDRSLGIIADTINGNANYRDRDEQLVLEWLEANGYV